MDKSKSVVVAITNLVIAGVIVWQILELNPTTRVYVRHYMQWVRWYAWSVATPEWLKEGLQVRGQI